MIQREQVLTYLQGKQEAYGGYTGNNITELAEFLNVTSQGLNDDLHIGFKMTKSFQALSILEKKNPPSPSQNSLKSNTNSLKIPFK
jgi:hypothetical protein